MLCVVVYLLCSHTLDIPRGISFKGPVEKGIYVNRLIPGGRDLLFTLGTPHLMWPGNVIHHGHLDRVSWYLFELFGMHTRVALWGANQSRAGARFYCKSQAAPAQSLSFFVNWL